ncbi:exosome complex exonuclease Rrp41 [archaeon]|nr:exosome complex exonuclease Rrp41 [archaeon]MBT6823905.1 exosome complex exonuclease Rrp41 [archaeon]MBT7297279.1 exosome complex exonuclease Rrp41 [archaeon]
MAKKFQRNDKRKIDEIRPMEAKVGVVPSAEGSAMFKMGKTIAIAAVRGPRQVVPAHKQKSDRGLLRCTYDLMSFSVNDRKRPGPSRRSSEISMVIENSLLPAMDLSKLPYTSVDLYVYITQADAGTRCVGINAASLALADAGIPMKELVSAVAVGKVDGNVILDLDKFEEDQGEFPTDIPIAMMPKVGKITLLQLDGKVSQKELDEAMKLAEKGCKDAQEVMEEAFRVKYDLDGGKKE